MASTLLRDLGEVKYTATGTLTAGVATLTAGGQVGIPMTNASSGDLVTLRVQGVFTVVKAAGTTKFAWTVGTKLYWDASGAAFTTVATSNTLAGRAHDIVAKGGTSGVLQLGVV